MICNHSEFFGKTNPNVYPLEPCADPAQRLKSQDNPEGAARERNWFAYLRTSNAIARSVGPGNLHTIVQILRAAHSAAATELIDNVIAAVNIKRLSGNKSRRVVR